MPTPPPATQDDFSIQAFADLWTQIYKHLIAIGYISSPASIHFPPHHDPPISPSLHSLQLHPLIVSLLPLLPYPSSYEISAGFAILPRTTALCFLDVPEGMLAMARNPAYSYYFEPGAGTDLAEDEIALTMGPPDGLCLVLNVTEGTIREVTTSDLNNDAAEPYPSDSPVYPALSALRRYLANLHSLDWLPLDPDPESGIMERTEGELHARLVRIVTSEYGWPDAFRREDWRRERSGVVRRTTEAVYG